MRRRLSWLILLLPLSAHADLYRWIDPETGSVKLSSQPPSDPRIEPQVVPYKAPPPKLAPKPAATATTPVSPSTADLEVRWRMLAAQIASIPPQELRSGSERVREQLLALQATRAELDRVDPAGVARRNAEMAAMIQRAPSKAP